MCNWKSIKNYENLYEVSDSGLVRSKARTILNKNGKPQVYPEKLLKRDPKVTSNGTYYRVTLSKDGLVKKFQVHRLVADAFCPNPEMKEFVNHIDNTPSNNNRVNLEWCSHSENMKHAQIQGRLHLTQSKAGKVAGSIQTNKMHKRMQKFIGSKVNNWLVTSIHESRKAGEYFLCRCDCGTEQFQLARRIQAEEITECKICARKRRSQLKI